MNPQDKELLEEKFKGVYTLLKSEFDSLNKTLGSILDQTKRTNGRVSDLETWKEDQRIFCGKVQAAKEGVEKEKDNKQRKYNIMIGCGMLMLVAFGFWERHVNASEREKDFKILMTDKVDSNTVIYIRGSYQKLDSVYWNDEDNPPIGNNNLK